MGTGRLIEEPELRDERAYETPAKAGVAESTSACTSARGTGGQNDFPNGDKL